MQVTYAGHPLYLFVGDRRAGQTAGEGLDNFGAEWYVVAATGRKVERKASTKSAPSSSNTGSGGYGAAGGVW
jgi:secreted repeat protein with Y-X4-D motif